MAHFARIAADGVVAETVYIPNDAMTDESGVEIEALGISYVGQHCGLGTWVQTSYNRNFRHQYGGAGMWYRNDLDLFVHPSPYPSWLLDFEAYNDWVAPVPKPEDQTQIWEWDEPNQSWVGHPIPVKPPVVELGA